MKFLTLYPGGGAFDSLFVPRGSFLYTMFLPGGGFLLPSSHVPRGWFWMKLIPAYRCKSFIVYLHKWNIIQWNFTELEHCLLHQCIAWSIRLSVHLFTDCLSAYQIKKFVSYFNQYTIESNMWIILSQTFYPEHVTNIAVLKKYTKWNACYSLNPSCTKVFGTQTFYEGWGGGVCLPPPWFRKR